MNISWTLIITAFGSLGWLLILREALQRWTTLKTGNNKHGSQTFQIQNFSQPIGRIRFTTLTWNNHEYCLAVDMQGAYIQLIDKRPLTKEKT